MGARYTEWRAEEYTSAGSGGKISWMWNKGMGLGKKILVAGFLVSSAPLVLPPLVVASTIAVISSVPYGLFLACYACTEKLMSKLLPPSSPFQYEDIYDDMEDVMENGRGLEKYVGKNVEGTNYSEMDRGPSREDEAQVDETGLKDEGVIELNVEGPGLGQVGDGFNEVTPVSASIQGEKYTSPNAEAAETPVEVTNVAVEIYQRPVVEEDDELARETEGLIEKIRDESRTDELVAKQTGENLHGGNNTTSGNEGKGIAEGAEKVDKSLAGKRSEVATEKMGKTEPERVGKMNASSIDGKDATVQTELDRREGKHEPTSVRSSSGKGIKTASDEVRRVEEAVWVKIDAMRAIVGYQAAKSASCIEELKALYHFTGVELPALSEAASDIAEVDEKLRFLMSVIGVK